MFLIGFLLRCDVNLLDSEKTILKVSKCFGKLKFLGKQGCTLICFLVIIKDVVVNRLLTTVTNKVF